MSNNTSIEKYQELINLIAKVWDIFNNFEFIKSIDLTDNSTLFILKCNRCSKMIIDKHIHACIYNMYVHFKYAHNKFLGEYRDW